MKRLVALALTCLLVLGLMPVSSMAEQSLPAFVLQGGKAQQGDTVQVTLSTQNNTGIVSLKVKIGYDSNLLSLTAIEGKDFADVTFGPLTKNPVTVNWLNSLEQSNTTNGVVAVLTFTVLDSAVDGDTAITATYDPEDVFDYNENNVAFDVVNGVVTIGCLHKETTTVEAKTSTCLVQGHEAYTFCNRCETLLQGSDELLPLASHTHTAQVVAEQYKVSDATCMQPAVYYHSCTLCGDLGDTTFAAGDVDKTNHCGTIVTVPAKDSTCVVQGHETYSYCDDCKEVVEGSAALLPLAKHTYTATVVADQYKVSDATCMQSAVYYHSCALCGDLGDTTFTVGEADKTNHCGTIVTVPAKASTCLEQGYEEYQYCDDCQTIVTGSDELLPFGDHDFTKEDTADEYKASDATCVNKATYYYSCALCGEKGTAVFAYGDEDKSNHVGGTHLEGAVDATYDAPGYTGNLCCDSCGDVVTPGTEIPQLQKETGLVQDGEVYRYLIDGEAQSGWYQIEEDWYYFFGDTLAAKEGSYQVGDVTYTFEKTGRLTTGVWAKTLYGSRYYYGPDYYRNGWAEIQGNRYYFEKGYRFEGIRMVFEEKPYWYNFGDNGVFSDEMIPDGFYQDAKKGMGYVVNGVGVVGLYEVNGDTYYFKPDKGYAAKGDCDGYVIGDDYKVFTGLLEKDGNYYYYEKGKPKMAGLVEVDGAYYFAKNADGLCVTNERYYIWMSDSGKFLNTNREFGADGKMLNGIIERDGNYYYYEDGQSKMAGLIEVDGAYYFAGDANGKLSTNMVQYIWKNEIGVHFDNANCEFGADGKMLNGVVEKDGILYYYEKGRPKQAGLVEIDGDYYFAGGYNAELSVNTVQYIWKNEIGVHFDNANCEFGADGKMLNGVVEKDGILYYYEKGRPKQAGLVEIDGDYYFVGGYNAELSVNTVQYIWKNEIGVVLENGNCEFGADGKMLNGIVEKDGVLYYYVMGRPKQAGLVEIDGDYYFAGGANGELLTGNQYIWKNEIGVVLENGNCEFGPDGKMLNGIVEKDGILYYYEMGRPKQAELICIDGDYYFVGGANGEVLTGKQYVWNGNGLLPENNYFFGEDGKMLNGFITEADGIHYYETGKYGKLGLHYIDGHYYFVDYYGKVWTNGTYYVWETNGLTLPMTYTFDEMGRIVL